MTNEERELWGKLKCSTVECTHEDEWLKLRKGYITASESACVIGVGFNTNVWLWEEKTGAHCATKYPPLTLALMNRGKVNESLSRRQWENETGDRVLDGSLILCVNDDILDANGKPFMAATLDGLGVRDDGSMYIVELKYSESASTFKNGTIPAKYRCQVLKQMIVTGLKEAVLISRTVWFDSAGQRVVSERSHWFHADDYGVKCDMEQLVECERRFWNEYVLTKRRPDILLPEI